jgi:pimeloyl-ACP methyl ester carboxylesterase
MRSAKNCVVLAAVCLVAACATTQSRTAPNGSAGTASYQTTPCPRPNIAGFPDLDVPPGVQCGYLTVLENRAKPDGRRIRIFVMRAPAVSATPKPDPIVYLSGGPGGAGSFEVAFMVKHGLNADREVIFVDQRGTHRADPLLACPEWEQFLFDSVSLPFAAESTTVADAAALKECHDRLVATGVDLAAYNSTENAVDIADLKAALGIDRWNVYGVSYGSRLALIVLRDHPQGIRSVVLDSVSPPTVNIVDA